MKYIIIFVLPIILFLSGCSTSGFKDSNVKFNSSNKVIFVSDHFSGYEAEHIGEVIRTFEKYGFTVTNDKNKSFYYLDFAIDAGAIVTVKIALRRDGKNAINISSSNAGWGTVIARPIAISSRISAALEELNMILNRDL